jgi:hypothetical protein
LRTRFPELPLLLEFDLRSPGEIHALEPFLLWASGITVRVQPPDGRGRDRLALLARLVARRKKPLRIRINPAGEMIVPGSGSSIAAGQASEIAAICIEQGCTGLSFLVAGDGMAGAARDVALSLDGDDRTRGIPIFLELPAEPIAAAIIGGSLLLDGIGDGICMQVEAGPQITGPGALARRDPVGLAYVILQGCRLRLTRAEFIACPSCGRTQFDLQSTTRRIQERTAHLAGVKIAIMGCVVNGPGEMADADFGYVGSSPGKIDLYVGRTRVRQAIPEAEADRRLIDLIHEHGMWTDPPAEE